MGQIMDGWQITTVRIVYASGALLSVIGSLFIILSFIFVKRLRTMTTFMVFMLGFSCLGSALFNCLSWILYKEIMPGGPLVELSTKGEEILCIVQAAGIQFFAVSSFLWISCLANHAFNILCRKKNEEALRAYIKYYVLVCYLIPAVTLVACIISASFGETEDSVWCWITHDHQEMRFAVYYIPLVVLWVFNVTIYILLSRESQSSLSYGYILKEGKKRLRLYILVFVVAKAPALINRLCNVFFSDKKMFTLFLLQAVFDSLFGFFEALVYIALVKKRLPKLWCKKKEVELKDPLIQRETLVPYSSIAERMYYSNSKKKRPTSING